MSKDEIKVPARKKGQMKYKFNETISTTKDIFKGLEDLVLSASLLIATFYNGYDLLNRPVGDFEYYVRATASVIIGLTGAWAIIKVFKRIGEEK